MNSFDFFDRVYCIHLPNPKRLVPLQEEFQRVGIESVQYLHAARPVSGFEMSNMRRAPPGEFGVNLSQMKAIVHAIADGAERPLFLEDDLVFAEDAEERLRFVRRELPEDWDVLYLGGHPRGKVDRYSSTLVRIGSFAFAEAYSIQRKALLAFADKWFDRIAAPEAMYDFILGEFAAAGQSYCTYPLLCEQTPGLSQIGGKVEDKRGLVARGWIKHLGLEAVTAGHRKRAGV